MDIKNEIECELAFAKSKFPEWPTDPFQALAVLQEEVGELTNAVLERTYKHKNDPSLEDIRGEGIQVAAMAIRFLENLEHYRFSPSEAVRPS